MAKEYRIAYKEQLKDQRWFYVRARVMERDLHKCQKCGTWRNLEVHHLRYEYGRKAWEYNDKDLLTLCDKCHEKVHKDLGDIHVDPLDEKLAKFVLVAKAYKQFMASKYRPDGETTDSNE